MVDQINMSLYYAMNENTFYKKGLYYFEIRWIINHNVVYIRYSFFPYSSLIILK